MCTDPFLVDGVNVSALNLHEASARVCDDVTAGSSFSVFTINLDHVVKIRNNSAFRSAYRRARLVLADGFPIVLAGRLQGRRVSRTPGSDLIEPLCEEAGRRGLPVVFFGSTFPSLAASARHLKNRIPDLEIAGAASPDFGFDPFSAQGDEAIAYIRNSGARICFVALGAPKQEIFADRCTQEIAGVSFVCIGAGLDFLAGHQTRAPKVLQAAGFEWLWRVLSNPRRLAGRYAACLMAFPGVIIRSALQRRPLPGC